MKLGYEYFYLMGYSVELDGTLGVIHPPKIKDLMNRNISYDEFIRPFLISTELLGEEVGNIMDIDLFFLLDNSKELLDCLVKSLKVLYRNENVVILSTIRAIKVGRNVLIHRDNYTLLSNIILEMMFAVRPKPKKKEQKYKNPHLQATWEKLQRFREEEDRKKALQMSDIMNTLIHINNDFNYDKVLNLTYYQLMNSYLTLSKKEGYVELMMYKTSGQFKIEQDTKHWIIETKVKRSAYSENE